MRYSLIPPQIKPIFSPMSKLWMFFIAFMVALMVGFNITTILRTMFFHSGIDDYKHEKTLLERSIAQSDNDIAMLIKKRDLIANIYSSNELLKDSLKNLFDLVPEQITLSRVVMKKDTLVLYGITPNKDVYNFLLASPLRSIFNSSQTVFYQNQSGWYRFISTNKINNSDGFNE